MGIFKKEVKVLEKDLANEAKALKQDVNIIEEEISLIKIIKYNLIFFIPIFISIFLSIIISKKVYTYLQITPKTTFNIVLIPFITLIFFLIIPYMRKREKIKGFRMTVFGFLIVGLVMTIPSTIKGDIAMMMNHLLYVAIYILLTFIYAPEILGIYGDIKEWFKHHHQLIIVFVYVSITIFFITGFAWQYYEINNDKTIEKQFNIPTQNPTYSTFLYYSIVTFATVGYGDIYPLGPAARLMATAEIFISTILNVLFITILLLYVSNLQAIKHHEHEQREEQQKKELILLKKKKSENKK